MDVFSHIFVSTSDLTIDKKHNLKSEFQNFKDGQVLKGKIIKNLPSHKAEISLLGRKIIAKTYVPLKEGDTILVKLSKTENESGIKLKLMQVENNNPVKQQMLQVKVFGKSGPYENLIKLFQNISSSAIKNSPAAHSVKPDAIPGRTIPGQNTDSAIRFSSKSISNESIPSLLKNISGAAKEVSAALAKSYPAAPGSHPSARPAADLFNLLSRSLFKPASETNLSERNNILTAFQKLSDTIKPKISENIPLNKKNIEKSFQNLFKTLFPDNAVMSRGNRKAIEQHLKSFIQTLISKGNSKAGISQHSVRENVNVFLKSLLANIDRSIKIGPGHAVSGSKVEGDMDKMIRVLFPDQKETGQTPSKTVLRTLENLTRDISIKSDTASVKQFQHILKSSGLSWENKLSGFLLSGKNISKDQINALIDKDLKGLAMKFLNQEAVAGSESEKNVKAFIDGLEKLQMVNKAGSEETGKYLLPLPLLFDEMPKFGQMLLDFGSGNNKGTGNSKNLVKVSFLLDMTNLGDVRADFSVLKNGITGTFGVSSSELRSYILENTDDLKKKLEEHGFTVHSLDCCVINPETLACTSLIDEVIQNGEKDKILSLVI